MGMYSFAWETELNGLTPLAWHGHEMIFGYALAVIAGFLLTAVKNWTGIQTLHAYKLFLYIFTPILVQPRIDGQYG